MESMASVRTRPSQWGRGRFRSRLLQLDSESLAAAACASFALLLFVGDVKGSFLLDWLPFDTTAAMAGIVLVLSVFACLVRGGKIRVEGLWMLALFIAFSFALLWTEFTPYSINKIGRFFTISLIVGVLPAMILTRMRDVRLFINTIVAAGSLISMAALQQVLFSGSIRGRIAGISSDTVSLGRSSGIALVGLYALSTSGREGRLWRALLCLPLLLVLVASSSRGPILFALLVIAFVALRWSRKNLRVIALASGLFLLLALLLVEGSFLLPKSTVAKIGSFLELRLDSSAEERVKAGDAAIDEIVKSPLGLGIGGFSQVYNFGNATDRVYPHNIVLEIAVEEGWLVALIFVSLVIAGIVRGYRAAVAEASLRPFFAIFIFVCCNALVSGDMNDNRVLYALLCIALMAPALVRIEVPGAINMNELAAQAVGSR